MKKKLPEIVMAVSIILTIVVLLSIFLPRIFGDQYSSLNANREVTIRWSEVNVRENHNIYSRIITTLEKGDTVILTGKSYEYCGGDGSSEESWQEIRLPSGKIGWVVTPSIKW